MKVQWQSLIDNLLSGSVSALARLITHVENREPGWMKAMQSVFPHGGQARVIGITGFGGVGKSTLTSRIAANLVEKGGTVGIIAVDPTSPFSGGALLGDRIRMTDVCSMKGVFIRSMATKGFKGGLNQAVRDVIRIMDAFGKDYVLVETVGAGQNEVDVVKVAEFVLLVCTSGQGDAIQCNKAGIMEIADAYIVNKADLDGADRVVMDINDMLALDQRPGKPKPPVIKASAKTGKGISEIVAEIDKRPVSATPQDAWQRQRVMEDITSLLNERITELAKLDWAGGPELDEIIEAVLAGRADPYSTVDQMLIKSLEQLHKKKES